MSHESSVLLLYNEVWASVVYIQTSFQLQPWFTALESNLTEHCFPTSFPLSNFIFCALSRDRKAGLLMSNWATVCQPPHKCPMFTAGALGSPSIWGSWFWFSELAFPLNLWRERLPLTKVLRTENVKHFSIFCAQQWAFTIFQNYQKDFHLPFCYVC